MKNKFSRSVTAIMLTAALLISSQGVVTAFADGGDHSDMSESSSVQMNEVSNNGTDQSTENGTGEDTAVKDIVEMINALPAAETITEETDLVSLKDQVNAARAAYDALSDDQKAAFDIAVLEKLTALEDKISDLESNEQETKPSDAVQAVVDAINALPAVEDLNEETNYEELKAQVSSARAAYDALSEEQKAAFDAAVLEKLTALEDKISELESGEQETAPSEAVQNIIEKIDAAVELIDYTTETITATDGTTVTKTHITMLKDLDPANNAELKALIDKEAAHEQDETQPALTSEEAAKLSDARKAFEDAKAKYLSEGFSNAQLAARQAYDALATEEEKAQVTNYSLLEAMEENIAYIMQAVNTLPTGSNPSDILGFTPNAGEYTYVSGESKWKAEPVDFSEPTTSGIEVDVSHVEEEGYIIYTIPEDFTASEININASKDIEEAFHGTYMPGDEGPFSIKLVNNSSKEYNYVENSFYVAPNPTPNAVYEESDPKFSYIGESNSWGTATAGWIDGAIGFDGSHILVYHANTDGKLSTNGSAIKRCGNKALIFLINHFGSEQENGTNQVTSLGDDQKSCYYLSDNYLNTALQKAGYSGISELNHYYIDYYNHTTGKNVSSLEEFDKKTINSILNSFSYTTVIETNPEIQELGFNVCYNSLLSVTFDGIEGDSSIGGWMRHENNGETTIAEILSSFVPGTSVNLPSIQYKIDGYWTGNAYTDYDLLATFGLKLSSPTPPVDPEDPTPTPDPDPTPRPGTGGDEDDDTPTIINETPVPTTTIEDEDVPMADLPEDTVTIDDEEVPLKDNPNTGDAFPVAAMAAAALSLGGVVALNRKKK